MQKKHLVVENGRGEKTKDEFAACLCPTVFIDCDNPVVAGYAERICRQTGAASPREKAISLYYAVRDEIRYDPYDLQYRVGALKASAVIAKGSGYCVAKAVVLAAVARQQGIPARLGFADVKNHLSTARLREVMGTDLFIYHGYTELLIDDRWVKATPAFNLSLCQRFQVRPLEFDGEHDSIFHEFTTEGERHMEYIKDHGSFTDLPFDEIFTAYRRQYPRMFAGNGDVDQADFHREAAAERKMSWSAGTRSADDCE